jgi:hypothetical protein
MSAIRLEELISLDLPYDLATTHFEQFKVLEFPAIREALSPLLIDERSKHVAPHERDSLAVYDAHDRRVSLGPSDGLIAPDLV